MSDKDKEAGGQKQESVVAIAQGEGRLQAVEVRRDAARFEVLWTQTGKDKQADWVRFATDCGLPTGPVDSTAGDDRKNMVAGFSSAGVVFNRIEVPAAAAAETESIVRLQAESRLPLSADQMELAWRTGHASNGQMPVTMAAARTEHLQAFVENIRDIAPARIMLDCEGIVKAWRSFFGGDERKAVVISAAADNCQICLAEDGELVNAVVFDMGTEDFSAGRVETEATERFVRDVGSVLEMFGYGDPGELPIVVLSDGGDAIKTMVAALESAGLNARAVMPDIGQMVEDGGLDADGVYDYRLPIGLGLAALESRGDELNIFERLYRPLEKVDEKSLLSSVKHAVVIAGAMLVVFLLVSYAVDRAKPGAIDNAIAKALVEKDLSDTDMKELINRQGLRKAIAAQRADMLGLIKLVNDIAQSGIKLQEIDFKMGQLAGISGESPGQDQVYKFEKDLNANKYIKDAKIQSQSRDAKSKKYKFSIEFRYKNFSDKKARR